jgi:hypothetical protein
LSIPVTDLQPGDRVILNCPTARAGATKREAQFECIFRSVGEAMDKNGIDALLVGPSTLEFLSAGPAWAKFLLQTSTGPAQILEYPGGGPVAGLPPFSGETALSAAFLIEPDGGLREEEGRRIFIERRLGRNTQG